MVATGYAHIPTSRFPFIVDSTSVKWLFSINPLPGRFPSRDDFPYVFAHQAAPQEG